jgi:hypothetical protein
MDGKSALLVKITEMPEPDRAISERLHAIIKVNAPTSRRNYGTDARVCRGQQDHLLLPKRTEAQNKVRDIRFQCQSEPRRRQPVASAYA